MGSLLVGGSLATSVLVEASPGSAAVVVVQTINVGCSPGAISSDGTHVWVGTYCPPPEPGVPPSGAMQEINASDTSEINGVIGGPAAPSGISSDGTDVWATLNGVTEVNASNGSVVPTLTHGVGNEPLGISSDGTHVWVVNHGGNTVTELSASTATVLQTIAVASGPTAISSDGTHVWVTNSADDTVSELNAATGALVQTIGVGSDPSGISSDGVHVWVANEGGNTVTELNASDGSVANTISVGDGPTGISSDGVHVWVSNTAGTTVSEITIPPSTTVVLPANNATVSGTTQYLDATASSGVTNVTYELSGGPSDLSDVQIATAIPTIFGWLGIWNSTSVPNGSYTLQSVGTSSGGTATSAPITITVNNVSPTTSVIIPSTGATQSGTAALLDAGTSADVTKVIYELSGGPSDLSDQVIATGTPTLYGWLAEWNTTTVPNGTYTLQSVASYSGGVSGMSPSVTINVNNPPPSTTVVLPANNATVSGTTQYLDATASSGVTKVIYELSGGPSELSDVQIATGSPTLYGWLAGWNTTTVTNGSYTLQSVASYAGGVSGTSPAITVTISN